MIKKVRTREEVFRILRVPMGLLREQERHGTLERYLHTDRYVLRDIREMIPRTKVMRNRVV